MLSRGDIIYGAWLLLYKRQRRAMGRRRSTEREREPQTEWNTMNYVELVKPWKLITNKDDEVCWWAQTKRGCEGASRGWGNPNDAVVLTCCVCHFCLRKPTLIIPVRFLPRGTLPPPFHPPYYRRLLYLLTSFAVQILWLSLAEFCVWFHTNHGLRTVISSGSSIQNGSAFGSVFNKNRTIARGVISDII